MLELPEVPTLVITLLSLFAPYAIALVESPNWSKGSKKLIAIAASLALTVIVLAIYYASSGEPIPSWPTLLVLGVLVSQSSYALVTKESAAKVEKSLGIK